MKKIILLLLACLWVFTLQAISFCAWNIENLGQSKSDAEIQYMAQTVKGFDIIGIEEIVTSPEGAKAVARLVDALNRTGAKWDYRISDPTTTAVNTHKQERYAFLWKPAKVKLIGTPHLDRFFANEIEREPYIGVFQSGQKTFRVFIFHAITQSQQPEREIKYFKFYPEHYPEYPLLFAGDFNCPENHSVFGPLGKLGFVPAFTQQKTTLRMACIQNDCLASCFDHIFYKPTEFKVRKKGIVPFYTQFADMPAARKISDHVPVFMEFD